ncbi:MAG: RNA 2',3'-cyclic phosphodiesterase [Deltaproteobacteria bacterium]|nr:RNA 2',3'-cyclic phosphodiesterase [Deltaproteobacteria bacterium]
MESLRTFIALELPEQLKKRLGKLRDELQGRVSGVRWVKPDNIHLTLKFLGPTGADKVERIAGILKQESRGLMAFSLQVAGLGAFPNTRNPKVVWAGLKVDEGLAILQQRLELALVPAGFAEEKRPFVPHLTLGRVRKPQARTELRAVFEQHGEIDLGTYTACRVTFYQSDLLPSGPVYTVLKAFELESC